MLGFEVRLDVGTPEMRFITVGPPNQPDTAIVLQPSTRRLTRLVSPNASQDGAVFEHQGQRLTRRVIALSVICLVGATSCGGSGEGDAEVGDAAATMTYAAARLEEIQEAVDEWASAKTLADARAAAERARNLVTGPATLGSGDLDDDGEVLGISAKGLLPSSSGAPGGLVPDLAGCAAVDRDVLGGDWATPADRWDILQTAITDWEPSNDTFPSLPSHPQRICEASPSFSLIRQLGGQWAP